MAIVLPKSFLEKCHKVFNNKAKEDENVSLNFNGKRRASDVVIVDGDRQRGDDTNGDVTSRERRKSVPLLDVEEDKR